MDKLFSILFIILLVSQQNYAQIPDDCDPEDDGFGQIGTLCLSTQQIQEIVDQLNNLDPSPVDNTSVVSNCKNFLLDDGRIAYEFSVQYIFPYRQSSEFVNQIVEFQGTNIPPGEPGELNTYTFDEDTQILAFNILHSDLEDKFGCEKIVSEDEFTWQCHDIKLTIQVGGMEQFNFNHCFTAILDRNRLNVLSVDIVRNEVEGFCCDNELNVNTQVRFCDNLSCDNVLEPPYVFKRRESIFLEHSIVNEEFKFLFLRKVQVKIGNYLVRILNFKNDVPGKIVYEFQSPFATTEQPVEVISQITTTSARLLQETVTGQEFNIENDYKVKGNSVIEVIPNDDLPINRPSTGEQGQQGQDSQQDQQEPTVRTVVETEESETKKILKNLMFALIGLVSFQVIVMSVLNCFKRKQAKKINVLLKNEVVSLKTDSDTQSQVSA